MPMTDFLFTSESVSEGHPDKVADQISDHILDKMLEQDPKSRVACETLVTTGMAVIAGEITTNAKYELVAKTKGFWEPVHNFLLIGDPATTLHVPDQELDLGLSKKVLATTIPAMHCGAWHCVLA